MTKAAGILFVSINGNALFLQRAATAPDCPGCWDFPGGGLEGDETAEQCAVREAREEVGFVPEGARVFHTRTISGSASVKGVAGPGGPPVSNVPVDGGSPVAEPAPPLVPAPNQMPTDVDFTTFVQRVTNEFTPELNDEHDGWAWAPVGAPPQPLHPGCQIALDRLAMDEVGVARAMADGRLTSPQRYENVTLWAIRLTGTGASYRPKHDEFVFREGADHLTPDALARWNGAPVIFQHPKGSLLDSEEFGKRVVGTVFLPYVAGDEAWGIAKIWDDDTNRLLSEEDLSTSPGVNFQDHKVNRVLRLEDGSKVLKEGKPSLVDHVAICQLGVWDKGGEPSGIRSEAREDSAMTAEEEAKAKADADAKEAEEKAKADAAKKDADDKEKAEAEKKAKEDAARKDADAGKDLDTKLSHIADAVSGVADRLDAMGKRMDAFEAKEKTDRKDADDKEKEEAERVAADKAKKDAAAKADDAETVHKRIADVERIVREQGAKLEAVPDDEHARIADAWARADDVISAFGQTTPRPMPGETAIMYRRRVAKLLQPHSPTWAKVDIGSKAFADDAAFAIVESQIHAEAAATARNPATVQAGTLRMVERKRDGHTVREFHGEPRAWMDEMAGATGMRATGSFNTGGLGRTN